MAVAGDPVTRIIVKIAGILLCATGAAAAAVAAPGQVFKYGRFGEVSVYRSAADSRPDL